MLAEKLYHGTFRERGQRIIFANKMEISKGDNHWLGNGSYFFVEALYAYKWILDMYLGRFLKHDGEFSDENLIKNYMILKANFHDQCRVFDLTSAEHKITFDQVYLQLNQKKEYSDKFREMEIADGVVINYMFDVMNYTNEFDIVRAIFIPNSNNYKNTQTRIGFMPQEQICVKNSEMVKEIIEFNYSEQIAFYKDSIKKLSFSFYESKLSYIENKMKNKSNSYRARPKSSYKKSHK
ncbi:MULTISPECIES: hypothetical protein [unclassified Paenibacillus]|uniref:hypothetical protein n=1 Tax=unclassified Paenibacillus TaxID=185978 RepID=UPI0009A910D3|nr:MULTISPECIES: hypothetical protein [unclassified Paenibacillus]SLK17489.1 hypothetical protein SAMN06272722_111114 [Paenibacillus sp. RU5A]SOC74804.1 hypothetical protein SAMN05880581_111114 [Paenibacillus sp. RU26A]SOC76923.1 hypothetical protein SAMN05880586_111114 [Paenibacillus sp. RU5M]